MYAFIDVFEDRSQGESAHMRNREDVLVPQSQRQKAVAPAQLYFGDAGTACADEERKRERDEEWVYIGVPRLEMRWGHGDGVAGTEKFQPSLSDDAFEQVQEPKRTITCMTT
jgi:hypothetical protein